MVVVVVLVDVLCVILGVGSMCMMKFVLVGNCLF